MEESRRSVRRSENGGAGGNALIARAEEIVPVADVSRDRIAVRPFSNGICNPIQVLLVLLQTRDLETMMWRPSRAFSRDPPSGDG